MLYLIKYRIWRKVMNRTRRKAFSILLSLIISAAYLPVGAVWAVDDASVNGRMEAADDTAASPVMEESDDTTAVDNINNTESKDTVLVESLTAASVTVDDKIINGKVDLMESDSKYLGTAEPANGYDLATVRQLWTDAAGAAKEQYLEYIQNPDGTYSFEVTAADTDSVVTAYFYDLNVWDGAVDLTWYDPDQADYEIETPAQLAGLAAITNGMVDENVTAEYMIKDNEGRYIKEGIYYHEYISTEPWEADLLTPNASEGGAGQVRDTVWRLPEIEKKNKLAEDDVHNDFMYRTVRLTKDLDMGTINWSPIGGKYAMNRDAQGKEDPKVIDTRFQGVLDGQGHEVTITCDRRAAKGFAYAMEIAFIGYLGGGVDYKNGYPKDTYMDYARQWVPTVRNLVIKGDVKGRRMVAGVVGRIGETNYGVLVENCANYASVYATDMRGCAGIVGAAWGITTIRNCYNSGTIHSNYWEHGGIVGSNGYEGSENKSPVGANIYNCYNIGDTARYDRGSESWIYDGQEIGVDGQAFAPYHVANCYYPAPESAIKDKTGYSVGETSKNKKARVSSVEAADLKADETLAKLNANGDVFIKDTANVNNGYPVLYFQADHEIKDATVTPRQTEGGTISPESVMKNLPYGTTIELNAQAKEGKRLNGYRVYFEDDSHKDIPANGFYTVTGKDVTIEGIFDDMVPSNLSFLEEGDGAPYYIKIEKVGHYKGDTYQPCDPVVLKSGDQVEKDDVIRITPVDICLLTTQPDIKYLEYTGRFYDPVFTEWSLDVVNKTAGTYRVTGDVEDIDIDVSPKTQGKQWTTVADTSWYTPETKEFTLTTARQLAGLSKLSLDGNTFEGVTIKLGNDISLENTEANSGDVYGYERSWMGIGASERNPFKGTFDGQGHTVKYMHRNFAQGYCEGSNGGLFKVTKGAVIKNVNVESGSYINVDGATMVCEFKNGANGGGVVGDAIDSTIENCSSSVDMSEAFAAGGIAGAAEGNTVIRNCTYAGSMNGKNESIGGIAGLIEDDGVKIIDCVNNGNITSMSWKVGGILGSGESYAATITRCVNNGSLTVSMKSTSSYVHAVGGILGYAGGSVICSQCINRGELKGQNQTYAMGGIAGTVIRGSLIDCYNTGKIHSDSTSKWAETSGIANVGTNRNMKATISNCYNAGYVSIGSNYSGTYGGVVAYGNADTNVISNVYCTNEAASSIQGKAGIAGTLVPSASLRTLSVPLGDSFAVDRKNINTGYPVLVWQDPEAVAVVNVSGVSKKSDSSVAVTWTVAGPRDGFELYRSVNGGAEAKVYSGPALSFTDIGLAVGNTYRYRVRAFRVSEGQTYYGEWSAESAIELLLAPIKLKSVKNNKKGTAEIKWKQVKNAAGYEIYRSMSQDSGYKKVKTVKVTKKNKKTKTLSFINKKLKKKKTYFYKIRYYRTVNGKKVYSEYSPVKKVKVKK